MLPSASVSVRSAVLSPSFRTSSSTMNRSPDSTVVSELGEASVTVTPALGAGSRDFQHH
ncbi:hypothetical protein [Salinarchaeum laminariae]|uniref:hypothetical protein n=1 Tax=Salinarchaeum laminariae TaxID=869888 RepID=UPI0020BEF32D|nr:hypothetical protein [Salinarchaeum laminariae]